MEVILANKRYLVAVEIISALMLALCIIAIKSEGEVAVDSWQAIGSYISVACFSVAFFPLCYLSWFSHTVKNVSYYFKLIFFWLLALAAVIILMGIGSMFLTYS
ncbi:hypothetical protein [Thalassotalea sp. G2M2-11]|uniref:hypothetical protein n=1 Tax=Thalassotalea sp. G2M2-11 TaxID=2787627 RepID=UPI0019CFC642|nr:hypothetical protein [Thalassotalea sp. G2M2-11]